MSAPLFVVLGLVVGVAHSAWLARGVRSRRVRALGWPARLGLVVATLVVAAREGHIDAAAAGWVAGFSLACAFVRRSWS